MNMHVDVRSPKQHRLTAEQVRRKWNWPKGVRQENVPAFVHEMEMAKRTQPLHEILDRMEAEGFFKPAGLDYRGGCPWLRIKEPGGHDVCAIPITEQEAASYSGAQLPRLNSGRPGEYSVLVTDYRMAPRYRKGEVLYVQPGKSLAPSNYVLAVRKAKVGGGSPVSVIGRLVEASGSRTIIEQLNPVKRITIAADQLLSLHRIVGSGNI